MWLCIVTFLPLLVTSASTLYWQFTYSPETYSGWKPINELGGMILTIPLGLLISISKPAGWLGLLGLILALYKKTYKPLLLSVVGAIVFGIYWPKSFMEIMSI